MTRSSPERCESSTKLSRVADALWRPRASLWLLLPLHGLQIAQVRASASRRAAGALPLTAAAAAAAACAACAASCASADALSGQRLAVPASVP